MRSLGAAAAAVLLVLGPSACTQDAPPHRVAPTRTKEAPPAPPAPSARPVVAEVAWRAGRGIPVSQVVGVAGSVGVYYVARKGRLFVVGIDLADGRELWAKQGPQDQPYGVRPARLRDGTAAALLGDGSRTYLAAISPRSGRVRWAGPRWGVSSATWWCAPTRAEVCVEGDDRVYAFGVDGRHRAYHDRTPQLDVDDGVASLKVGGTIVWARRISGLRRGWTVHRWYSDPHHGRLFLEAMVSEPGRALTPAETSTFALDARTGRLAWALDGAEMCPLTLPNGEIYAEQAYPSVQTFCVHRGGTLANWWEGRGRTDTSTDLVAVDLRSGTRVWRRPYGKGGIGPDAIVPTLDMRHAYVELQVDEELVDVVTGRSAPVPAGYVAWLPMNWNIDISADSFSRAGIFRPTREGETLDAPSWPLPDRLGAASGAIHAIATERAIVGYRAGVAPAR